MHKKRWLFAAFGPACLGEAVNLAQEHGWFHWVPDWCIALLFIASGWSLIWWGALSETVHTWVANKRSKAMWTFLIVGAIAGTSSGWLLWWSIQRQPIQVSTSQESTKKPEIPSSTPPQQSIISSPGANQAGRDININTINAAKTDDLKRRSDRMIADLEQLVRERKAMYRYKKDEETHNDYVQFLDGWMKGNTVNLRHCCWERLLKIQEDYARIIQRDDGFDNAIRSISGSIERIDRIHERDIEHIAERLRVLRARI